MLISIIHLKSQNIDFSIPTDSVFVGDTISLLNNSTGYPSETIFKWKFTKTQFVPNDTLTSSDSLIYQNDSISFEIYNSCSIKVILYATSDSITIIDSLEKTFNSYPKPFALQIANNCNCEMVLNGSFEDYSLAPSINTGWDYIFSYLDS